MRVYENKQINEKIYEMEHHSGLRVLIVPKKFTKSYAIIGTRYGSIDSEFNGVVVPDGIAHFLEHKLFEQPSGENAFDEFGRLGASANAYTSFTNTCYLFSATSNFYESLEILLDFVFAPHFTAENVAKEQGIIAQEIRMYDDDPSWRVFFNMLGGMFHKHPVRRDIAGTVESISEITPETLQFCYDTFYNPANMVLVVAGDIDIDEVMKRIDDGVRVSEAGVIERAAVDEPEGIFQAEVEQKLAVSESIFLMGFKGRVTPLSGAELLREDIISSIAMEIAIGRVSPLYEKLYDSGLINESFSFDFVGEESFSYASLGGESSEPSRVREVVKEAIEAGFEVQDADVERIKNKLIGRYMRRFNDVERIGHEVISDAFCGINSLEYLEICEGVTADMVRARLGEMLDTEKMVLSVVAAMP